MTRRGLLGLSFLFTWALARAQGDNETPTLQPDAIQSGSFTDGSDSLGADAAQTPSLTSQNNFINFCAGRTLTNGLQITEGSCNGIVMGQIPSTDRMISAVITNPQNGDDIEAGQEFNITVQVANLAAGAFTNAVATYYSAPQQLDSGNIVGHVHVTVQDTGPNLNPTQPMNANEFAFFKGINDAGDGQGKLTAVVTGGLPAGNYRLCTMVAAANHQPVIMPVAQRGAQDDCIRFTVSGDVDTVNESASNGEKGRASAALAAQAVSLGPGAPNPGGKNGGDGNGNNNNGGGDNTNNEGDDNNDGNNNNSGSNGSNGNGNGNNNSNSGGDNANDDNDGNNGGDDGANGRGNDPGNNRSNRKGKNRKNGSANAGNDDSQESTGNANDNENAERDGTSSQGQQTTTASASAGASQTATPTAGGSNSSETAKTASRASETSPAETSQAGNVKRNERRRLQGRAARLDRLARRRQFVA